MEKKKSEYTGKLLSLFESNVIYTSPFLKKIINFTVSSM